MIVTEQASFGGGIFRGRRAPEDTVYDAFNMLIDSEGQLIKRGGTVFASDPVSVTLDGLASVQLGAGPRALLWGAGKTSWFNPAGGAVTDTPFAASYQPARGARIAVVDGIALFIDRASPGTYVGWAGSVKAPYSTGTATVAVNSGTVTGVGTSWTANVDAGMILSIAGSSAVVKSVQSNTSLTLTRPWQGAAAAAVGYSLIGYVTAQIYLDSLAAQPVLFSAIGTVGLQGRLLLGSGNRIYFSDPWHPFFFGPLVDGTPSQFLDLPRGETITGIQGLGDTALVFTTGGVWAVSNTSLEPLDDFGNVQWQVEQIATQVVLWGDPGMAAWSSGLVVPALDDVYLMGLGQQPQSITGDAKNEKIRSLYRARIAAGYRPGKAAIFNSHYLLPFYNGSTPVEVLVCRLDRGAAWTRWDNAAAGFAVHYTVAGAPVLYGINGTKAVDATGCFAPVAANKNDAGGSAPPWLVITRDFDTGPGVRGGIMRHARLEYELVDAASDNPTIAVAAAAGSEGAALTPLSQTAPEAADGVKTWMVNKAGERVRLAFSSSQAAASAILKRLEIYCQESRRP